MNTKKSYRLFLVIILTHIAVVFGVAFLRLNVVQENFTVNCILSEMIIWVPCLLFLAVTRTEPLKFCRIRRTTVSTLLKTVLFTVLCMPVIMFVNALSMLFVDNVVLDMSSSILNISLPASVLLLGVYGPFCEEFVFRGVIYRGLKKQGNGFLAVLMSALLFGLMHMNFNQAPYAFVIGIGMALLAEATDSLWPTFLMHFLINTYSTVVMYITRGMTGDLYEQTMEQAANMGKSELFMAVSAYFVLAVIFTPLAACVLCWIAKGENKLENMREIWYTRRTDRKSYVTVSLVAGVVLCLAVMILTVL